MWKARSMRKKGKQRPPLPSKLDDKPPEYTEEVHQAKSQCRFVQLNQDLDNHIRGCVLGYFNQLCDVNWTNYEKELLIRGSVSIVLEGHYVQYDDAHIESTISRSIGEREPRLFKLLNCNNKECLYCQKFSDEVMKIPKDRYLKVMAEAMKAIMTKLERDNYIDSSINVQVSHNLGNITTAQKKNKTTVIFYFKISEKVEEEKPVLMMLTNGTSEEPETTTTDKKKTGRK